METGEAVAIKKVLQDKRYKNRELQIMRMLEHPNVVQLKHYFYSTTEKDELYLNLVLEYVSETVYRVSRHYGRINQSVPVLYVQLYTYQVNIPKTFCPQIPWVVEPFFDINCVFFVFFRCAVLLTTYTTSLVYVIVILSLRMYWYDLNFRYLDMYIFNCQFEGFLSQPFSGLKALHETFRMVIVWFSTVQHDYIIPSPAL